MSFSNKILCVGESMAELVLADSDTVALGFAGDTMNTAVYLRRLLSGGEVGYMTRIGHDPLSLRYLTLLESESIQTDLITKSDDRTIGIYAISTDEKGERSFSYWRSHSAARTMFQNENGHDFSDLASANVVYLSAITLAILPGDVRKGLLGELARLRKESDLLVAFDSNYRPLLWESRESAQSVVADAWRITDIALPSVDDEQLLFEDASEADVIARLHSYGIQQGALKRGELGPISLASTESATTQSVELPQYDIKVVDTTAAGDSFNAGYLASKLSGESENDALLAGHNCACRVIAHAGAIVPLSAW